MNNIIYKPGYKMLSDKEYKPKILFILGNFIGGDTFTRRLVEAINNPGLSINEVTKSC
jgi:hypothetical protein